MKKLLSIIIFCLLVVLPINASALSAKSVSVSGPSEVKQGEEFELSIDVSLDTLDPEGTIMFGVIRIDYQYDALMLIPTDAKATNFNTTMHNDNGNHYILSYIEKEDFPEQTNCTNNILCNKFNAKLKFFAKGSGSTIVNVISITTSFMDLKNATLDASGNAVIPDDDYIIETKEIVGSTKVNLIPNGIPKDIPVENAETNSGSIELKHLPTNVKKETPKDTSGNNSLKSLSIDNYPIEFDTHKLKYNINVPEGVNSVKVNAVADDDTAKIKVIGANDLAKNNYVITVEVTAQNGSKKSYVIATRGETEPTTSAVTTTEAKEEKTRDDEAIKEDQEKRKKINKKIISYVIIGVITIILLVIANAIINKIRYRKLDKMLKKF